MSIERSSYPAPGPDSRRSSMSSLNAGYGEVLRASDPTTSSLLSSTAMHHAGPIDWKSEADRWHRKYEERVRKQQALKEHLNDSLQLNETAAQLAEQKDIDLAALRAQLENELQLSTLLRARVNVLESVGNAAHPPPRQSQHTESDGNGADERLGVSALDASTPGPSANVLNSPGFHSLAPHAPESVASVFVDPRAERRAAEAEADLRATRQQLEHAGVHAASLIAARDSLQDRLASLAGQVERLKGLIAAECADKEEHAAVASAARCRAEQAEASARSFREEATTAADTCAGLRRQVAELERQADISESASARVTVRNVELSRQAAEYEAARAVLEAEVASLQRKFGESEEERELQRRRAVSTLESAVNSCEARNRDAVTLVREELTRERHVSEEDRRKAEVQVATLERKVQAEESATERIAAELAVVRIDLDAARHAASSQAVQMATALADAAAARREAADAQSRDEHARASTLALQSELTSVRHSLEESRDVARLEKTRVLTLSAELEAARREAADSQATVCTLQEDVACSMSELASARVAMEKLGADLESARSMVEVARENADLVQRLKAEAAAVVADADRYRNRTEAELEHMKAAVDEASHKAADQIASLMSELSAANASSDSVRLAHEEMRALRVENATLRNRLTEASDMSSAAHAECATLQKVIDTLQMQVEHARSACKVELETEVARARHELTDCITRLNAEHTANLNRTLVDHAAELGRMRDSQSREGEVGKRESEAAAATARAKAREEFMESSQASMKMHALELSDLRRAHDTELSAMRRRQDEELSALRGAMQAAVEKANQEAATARADRDKGVLMAQQQANTAIAAAQAEAVSAVSLCKSESESTCARIRAEGEGAARQARAEAGQSLSASIAQAEVYRLQATAALADAESLRSSLPQSLEETRAGAVRVLAEEHARKLADMRAEFTALSQAQLQRVEVEWITRCEAAEQAHSLALSNARFASEESIAQARKEATMHMQVQLADMASAHVKAEQQHASAMQGSKDAFDRQLSSAREEHAAALVQVREGLSAAWAGYKAEAEERFARLEMEVLRFSAEADGLRAALLAARAQPVPKQSLPSSTLFRSSSGLKLSVPEVGGSDNENGKDSAPGQEIVELNAMRQALLASQQHVAELLRIRDVTATDLIESRADAEELRERLLHAMPPDMSAAVRRAEMEASNKAAAEHEMLLSALHTELQRVKENARLMLSRVCGELEEEKAQRIALMERDTVLAAQAHAAAMEALQVEHTQKVSDMQEAHLLAVDRALVLRQAEFTAALETAVREQDSVRMQHEDTVRALRHAHESSVAALRREHDSSLARIQRSYADESSRSLAAHASAQQEWQARSSLLENGVDMLKAQLQEVTARLEKKMQDKDERDKQRAAMHISIGSVAQQAPLAPATDDYSAELAVSKERCTQLSLQRDDLAALLDGATASRAALSAALESEREGRASEAAAFAKELREGQALHNAAVIEAARLSAQSNKDFTDLKERHAIEVSALRAAAESGSGAAAASLAAVQVRHGEEVARLSSAHAAAIAELGVTHRLEMDALRSSHAQALNESQVSREQELRGMREASAFEAGAWNRAAETLQASSDKVARDMDAMQRMHAVELASSVQALRKEHTAEIEAMMQEHQTSLDALQGSIRELMLERDALLAARAAHEARHTEKDLELAVSAMRQKHAAALEALKYEHESALGSVRREQVAEAATRDSVARSKLMSVTKSIEIAHAEQMRSLEAQLQAALAAADHAKGDAQSTLAKARALHEQAIAELQGRLFRVQAALDEANRHVGADESKVKAAAEQAASALRAAKVMRSELGITRAVLEAVVAMLTTGKASHVASSPSIQDAVVYVTDGLMESCVQAAGGEHRLSEAGRQAGRESVEGVILRLHLPACRYVYEFGAEMEQERPAAEPSVVAPAASAHVRTQAQVVARDAGAESAEAVAVTEAGTEGSSPASPGGVQLEGRDRTGLVPVHGPVAQAPTHSPVSMLAIDGMRGLESGLEPGAETGGGGPVYTPILVSDDVPLAPVMREIEQVSVPAVHAHSMGAVQAEVVALSMGTSSHAPQLDSSHVHVEAAAQAASAAHPPAAVLPRAAAGPQDEVDLALAQIAADSAASAADRSTLPDSPPTPPLRTPRAPALLLSPGEGEGPTTCMQGFPLISRGAASLNALADASAAVRARAAASLQPVASELGAGPRGMQSPPRTPSSPGSHGRRTSSQPVSPGGAWYRNSRVAVPLGTLSPREMRASMTGSKGKGRLDGLDLSAALQTPTRAPALATTLAGGLVEAGAGFMSPGVGEAVAHADGAVERARVLLLRAASGLAQVVEETGLGVSWKPPKTPARALPALSSPGLRDASTNAPSSGVGGDDLLLSPPWLTPGTGTGHSPSIRKGHGRSSTSSRAWPGSGQDSELVARALALDASGRLSSFSLGGLSAGTPDTVITAVSTPSPTTLASGPRKTGSGSGAYSHSRSTTRVKSPLELQFLEGLAISGGATTTKLNSGMRADIALLDACALVWSDWCAMHSIHAIRARVSDISTITALGRAIEAASAALSSAGEVVEEADEHAGRVEEECKAVWVQERGETHGQEEAEAFLAFLAPELESVLGRYGPLVAEGVRAAHSCVEHLLATGEQAGLDYSPGPSDVADSLGVVKSGSRQ